MAMTIVMVSVVREAFVPIRATTESMTPAAAGSPGVAEVIVMRMLVASLTKYHGANERGCAGSVRPPVPLHKLLAPACPGQVRTETAVVVAAAGY